MKPTRGPWTVQADPEWKGRHPLHDNRFIVAGEHEIGSDEFERDPESQIIAKMTDCQQQAANARLIAKAPEMLQFMRLVSSGDFDESQIRQFARVFVLEIQTD